MHGTECSCGCPQGSENMVLVGTGGDCEDAQAAGLGEIVVGMRHRSMRPQSWRAVEGYEHEQHHVLAHRLRAVRLIGLGHQHLQPCCQRTGLGMLDIARDAWYRVFSRTSAKEREHGVCQHRQRLRGGACGWAERGRRRHASSFGEVAALGSERWI